MAQSTGPSRAGLQRPTLLGVGLGRRQRLAREIGFDSRSSTLGIDRLDQMDDVCRVSREDRASARRTRRSRTAGGRDRNGRIFAGVGRGREHRAAEPETDIKDARRRVRRSGTASGAGGSQVGRRESASAQRRGCSPSSGRRNTDPCIESQTEREQDLALRGHAASSYRPRHCGSCRTRDMALESQLGRS